MLATKLILDQGIHVEALNFFTGFCVEGHTHAIRKKDQQKSKRNNALWVSEQLGIPLHIEDIVEPYKDIVLNPKYGYGAHLNPCLDCKVFMVKKAYEWMCAHQFDFIITGEVIGQRPKSQRKETMPIIAEHSQAGDRLLRPLCAKLLPPTYPEKMGWVQRDRLLDISGRSRKGQMALAQHFNIEEYAQPAGGCCFLTDASYSRKLEDLWTSRGSRRYELDDILLLKVGRHVRPMPEFKLIIAREEGENNYLQGYKKQYPFIEIVSHPGPLTLIDGTLSSEHFPLAAQICARFSGGKNAPHVDVRIHFPNGDSHLLSVSPFSVSQIEPQWYLQ